VAATVYIDQYFAPVHAEIREAREKVLRLEQKVVMEAGIEARITHAGQNSAKMIVADKISLWVDVRMILLTDEKEPHEAELYAKVTSVSAVREGFEAAVHFTSINPEADRIIRGAIEGP
jgi:acetylornithine deacetylase/succinyl-diaminopimelate desuccinylase-like protein